MRRPAHNVDLLDYRRWQLARRVALEAAGWRCRTCGRAGRLQVDHKMPLKAGGSPYAQKNLQPLCQSCHQDKTWAENGATLEQRRWRVYQRRIDLVGSTR